MWSYQRAPRGSGSGVRRREPPRWLRWSLGDCLGTEVISGPLSGEELEIERGDHEVDEEEQQEGDHHGLVDCVAHALRAGRRVESAIAGDRSEEHTSALQSLMRNSYGV